MTPLLDEIKHPVLDLLSLERALLHLQVEDGSLEGFEEEMGGQFGLEVPEDPLLPPASDHRGQPLLDFALQLPDDRQRSLAVQPRFMGEDAQEGFLPQDQVVAGIKGALQEKQGFAVLLRSQGERRASGDERFPCSSPSSSSLLLK